MEGKLSQRPVLKKRGRGMKFEFSNKNIPDGMNRNEYEIKLASRMFREAVDREIKRLRARKG